MLASTAAAAAGAATANTVAPYSAVVVCFRQCSRRLRSCRQDQLSTIDRISTKGRTTKSVVKKIFHYASELLLLSYGNDTIDQTPKRNI